MATSRRERVEELHRALRAETDPARRAELLAMADPEEREALLMHGDTVPASGPVNVLQLGPYRLEEPLGSGGMGEVFRARDLRLGRVVAVKLIRGRAAADPGARERFQREARAASAIDHPNVCMVHDVGEHDGIAYLVMEYLEGETLERRLERGPLPLPALVEVGGQMLEALDAAHSKGIVHRDVKPSNVFLTTSGQVKVMDFGIAKLDGPGDADGPLASLTGEGGVIGTIAYMSPEQARGEKVDVRSDLFSLGAVLYEMATGTRAFRGLTPAVLFEAILRGSPVPPREIRADLPDALQRLILGALERARERRPVSAAQMLRDLRALPPGEVRPPPARRGWRTIALFLGVAAIVLASGLTLLIRGGAAIHSLAVLPFERRTDAVGQETLAGLGEALVRDLAVRSPQITTRAWSGGSRPLSEIGREASADAVLRGTVEGDAQKVRVEAEVLRASDGRRLWRGVYEHAPAELQRTERDIAGAVVRILQGVVLAPARPEEAASNASPEAYDLYLRGLSHLVKNSREDIDQAIHILERSVEAAPDFLTAQAALTLAYGNKAFLYAPDDPQWEEKAYAQARRLLDRDPGSAEGQYAMAVVLWRPSQGFPAREALRLLRNVLGQRPDLDEAWHQHGNILFHVGHLDAGLQDVKKALELNPANAYARIKLGSLNVYRGRYQEAIDALHTVPRGTFAGLWTQQMAWALLALGRQDEAAREIDGGLMAFPTDPGGRIHAARAMLRALRGDRAGAEADITEAVRIGKPFGEFHHTAYAAGAVYSTLGDQQKAQAWIEEAARSGFPCYSYFESDPFLRRLREVPAFRAFLADLRRQWETIPDEGS
jgi:serine/threonine protein kinase/tetratricopeptide (TPR) repeat protein/TolB-like protein